MAFKELFRLNSEALGGVTSMPPAACARGPEPLFVCPKGLGQRRLSRRRAGGWLHHAGWPATLLIYCIYIII